MPGPEVSRGSRCIVWQTLADASCLTRASGLLGAFALFGLCVRSLIFVGQSQRVMM